MSRAKILRMGCCIAALLGVVAGGIGAAEAQGTGNLMPVPQTVAWSGGAVPFGKVRVVWDTPLTALLRGAVARFDERLRHISGAAEGPEYVLHLRAGQDPAYLTLHEQEAYHLQLGAQGGQLTADGPAGALHGLATFLQLVERAPSGAVLRMADVTDAPRFAWRGLLLDVSRHFITVESVKRQLDAMELVKLNVLHWHLSDGTGFRVESHKFPKINAGSPYYTQKQVREIVAYAAARGIRIVPEIDVPGHAYAILRAYPNLSAEPLPKAGYTGEKTNLPAMDPTNPDTLKFVQALYAEMEPLFPDLYFHAGGDEVAAQQWTDSRHIQDYMASHHIPDVAALQGQFTAAVGRVLAAQGRIMVGWDEVSTAPVPKNVVIEGWRGSKWTASAIRSGHDVLVSSGYYLDLLRPAASHYGMDPYDVKVEGLTPEQVAEAKPKPSAFVDAFSQDPTVQPLTAEEEKHVLGAEIALWTELASDQMVDARLWPRSAAIAERFWSSAQQRDVADMERRLVSVQDELEATGLQAREHTASMLKALTGGREEPALNVLLSALIPASNYVLNRAHDRSGLDVEHGPAGVVDPDSHEVLRFNALVQRYKQGETAVLPELRGMLSRWAENGAVVSPVLRAYPALGVLEPASHDLSVLAKAGLARLDGGDVSEEAVSALRQQEQWVHNTSNALLSVRRPQAPGGVMLGIVPGLSALFQ